MQMASAEAAVVTVTTVIPESKAVYFTHLHMHLPKAQLNRTDHCWTWWSTGNKSSDPINTGRERLSLGKLRVYFPVFSSIYVPQYVGYPLPVLPTYVFKFYVPQELEFTLTLFLCTYIQPVPTLPNLSSTCGHYLCFSVPKFSQYL